LRLPRVSTYRSTWPLITRQYRSVIRWTGSFKKTALIER
jgi:hypothetical protein